MGLPGLWLASAGAHVVLTDCHPGEAPHIRYGSKECEPCLPAMPAMFWSYHGVCVPVFHTAFKQSASRARDQGPRPAQQPVLLGRILRLLQLNVDLNGLQGAHTADAEEVL